MFELINYSEFGTEVNGHLYACDFSDHSGTEYDPAYSQYGNAADTVTDGKKASINAGQEHSAAAKCDPRNQLKQDVQSILEKSRKTREQRKAEEAYASAW